MVKFHGAIDYIILKNNKQYFIFFLDNHNPQKYCSIPAQNIDSLFQHFINNEPNTTFIFEELFDKTKFIHIFPDTPHLKKYFKYYNTYKSTKQFYPIDIINTVLIELSVRIYDLSVPICYSNLTCIRL